MITSETGLKKFILDIKNSEWIAVDTEADSLYAYPERLCLIQISIENCNEIIDPFGGIKDIKLVVAGKKGWLYESIYVKVEELNLQKDVIFTGFVEEEDKAAIMKGAKLFTAPSFWEGFGIPVIESMACGTPVVVSNTASLPEVVGDVGVYVNPNKKESIYTGIKKVLDMNDGEYNKLSSHAAKAVNSFSWKKTGEKTVKILMEAAK